jgi:hypothetical protein
MARPLNAAGRTAAVPNLASWTAADSGIHNTAANSPVELKGRGRMLTIMVSANIATTAMEFHLIAEDANLRATKATLAAGDDSIIGWIPMVATASPTARTQQADNGGTTVLHVPIQFDLRGMPDHSDVHYYLALANAGGANPITLIDYKFTDASL